MSRLLPRMSAVSEHHNDQRKIGRILLESEAVGVPATVARATLPGDNRRLRGIPVVARGVAGVSPGTHPALAVR